MENWNYFNYFTEIEEYFWRKRGAHLLVSPLDWAVMETWQKAGVPLEAALLGIDRAFESYQRSRRGAGKALKSLAYCTDAVLDAAEERQEAAAGAQPESKPEAKQPFSRDELRAYLERNSDLLQRAATRCNSSQPALSSLLRQVSDSVASTATLQEAPGPLRLEDLERQLTILDDKIYAALLTHANESLLLKIRREVDSQLSAYRRKMKADQLALVERQYSQKRLLDEYQVPRLSLYYFS
jgi:ABC-type transporter Mla subunit MlaD